MRLNIILAGAPRSGKSTTLNGLKDKLSNDPRFKYIDEIVTKYVNGDKKKFVDLLKLNRHAMEQQIAEENEAAKNEGTICILDRSLIDDLAIVKQKGIGKKENDSIEDELKSAVKTRKYDLVFFLERLPFKPENSEDKQENINETKRNENSDADNAAQEKYLLDSYQEYSEELGYEIIKVPLMSISERVDHIHNEIKKFMVNSLQTTTTISNSGFFATNESARIASLSTASKSQTFSGIALNNQG